MFTIISIKFTPIPGGKWRTNSLAEKGGGKWPLTVIATFFQTALHHNKVKRFAKDLKKTKDDFWGLFTAACAKLALQWQKPSNDMLHRICINMQQQSASYTDSMKHVIGWLLPLQSQYCCHQFSKSTVLEQLAAITCNLLHHLRNVMHCVHYKMIYQKPPNLFTDNWKQMDVSCLRLKRRCILSTHVNWLCVLSNHILSIINQWQVNIPRCLLILNHTCSYEHI